MVVWAEVDEPEEEEAFVEDSDEIEATDAEADANVSFQVGGRDRKQTKRIVLTCKTQTGQNARLTFVTIACLATKEVFLTMLNVLHH